MRFLYFALLFCFSPIVQVYASTPKSVTCTRTEYREEYIPGTKSSPGYVNTYEVDVVIPCEGQSQAEIDDDLDIAAHVMQAEKLVPEIENKGKF